MIRFLLRIFAMPNYFRSPSVGVIAIAVLLHALSTIPTQGGLTLFCIGAGASVVALVLARRGW